jgi:hypothetical protein
MKMSTMTGDGGFQAKQSFAKSAMIVLLVSAAILLVPLVAMQFTNEVVWTLSDFVVAGVLLVGTGLAFAAGMRKARSVRNRAIFGAAILVAFLLVWAELAVGIFGTPFAGS